MTYSSLFMPSFMLILCLAVSNHALGKAPIETGFFNNKAIYGYDSVAYFKENRPRKGSKKYVYPWRGADWYFSSSENKRTFISSPETYAPQYGGYCAYAVGNGQLAKIDPKAFSIVNGKLYLNYSKDILNSWFENKDTLIIKADKNYPMLVDLPTPGNIRTDAQNENRRPPQIDR